jgi:hypothetical protein
MSAKEIRLRYAGKCVVCHEKLAPGTHAWWDSDARTITCFSCVASGARRDAEPLLDDAEQPPLPGPTEPVTEQPRDQPQADVERAIDRGVAGASAQREFDKLHARREKELEARWGPFAGIAKRLSDDPPYVKAWRSGAEGERLVAERLHRELGDRAVLLHDRSVPNTRRNIDHVAVAASGVWVIDTKHYRKGRVERRDVGGLLRADHRLYVGGRNETKLVEGLGWQIDAVRRAADEACDLRPVLCFSEAGWKLLQRPIELDGVLILWPKKLVEIIARPGPLSPSDVERLARRIAAALPSKRA